MSSNTGSERDQIWGQDDRTESASEYDDTQCVSEDDRTESASEYDDTQCVSEDDRTESASEYDDTQCVSEDDRTESASEYDDTQCVSEDDRTETVSRDDSAKQKSIISPSFPKKWTRDKEVHEPSYSQTKTSRHKAWTEWAKHHLDFNEPAHAVISRAPISRAQCGTDSTDIKNKSNTTTSPTNKRARGIEDNGSHHRKGKTARYEGPYTIKSPSISTSTSRPSHATGHDQGITDTTADVQTTNYTTAVNPASDQYSNNDEARTITSDAPVHMDNSAAQAPKRATTSTSSRKTGVRGSRAGSEHTPKIPASGNQMSPQAHIQALTADDEVSTQIMRELALHAHTAPIDHQSLQNINNVHRAIPACTGARPKAPTSKP